MSKILCDYHIHTPLCHHAEGEPHEYVGFALKKNLKSIGFADHCPVPNDYEPEWRMKIEEFTVYRKMIETVQKLNPDIDILFGMELEYIPDRKQEIENYVSDKQLDYLIGSVHYVDRLPFDSPDKIEQWNDENNIEYVWDKYFDIVIDMVTWGKFTFIGHLDLPKKFSMYPKCLKKVYAKIEHIFDVAVEKNILMEINTAGLRKPVKEFYPSLEILKMAYEKNVGIVFGSDSHKPDEVGKDFEAAAEIATVAGYKYYNVLKRNNKIEKIRI